jgi:hypothetical protein
MTNKEHLAALQANASEKAEVYLKEFKRDGLVDPSLLVQLRKEWDDAEDSYQNFLAQVKSAQMNLADPFP